MKVLWALAKVAIVLVLLIPVSLFMLGLFGTVLGLALTLLRFAVIGLLAYGAFRLFARLIRGPTPRSDPMPARQLGSGDPYYQAAMRELDRDIA